MSGSGRHSSHGGTSGSRTPNSTSFPEQSMSAQQYLRPEDIYRMDRDGTYYGTSSYSQSRHGSDTNSPRHGNATTSDHGSRRQSNPHSPYIEYPYTDLSRHGNGHDTTVHSSRRTTAPDQATTTSRHSYSSSQSSSPKDKGSAQGSPKGKGKAVEDERHPDPSRRVGGRHGDGDSGSGRKGSGRLVSGVFIRY